MKSCFLLILLGLTLYAAKGQPTYGPDDRYNVLKNPSVHYDNRVDNMLYWNHALREGYVEAYRPKGPPSMARYVGSQIATPLFILQDSPDVAVAEGNLTQSENSIITHPLDFERILNSNNSSNYPTNNLFGANWLTSGDAGETWEGEMYGAGGDNSGDPAVGINAQGRWFIGYINESFGQSVAYSDDEGQNWIKILIAPAPGFYPAGLDKNHLWVDNSSTSIYNGNVYTAWTRFSAGGTYDGEIQLSRSTNGGTVWSNPMVISEGVTAGSHNQGVNIQTGPDGQVYVVWAIYDTWPADENALGFTASLNGGETFQPARRIIDNIQGIRYSQTSKNLRVNSFPSMTVDLSNGPHRGTIYVVWANYGVPGINTGDDIDVYLIKSSDQGLNWSQPVRVNQDIPGLGKQHFFPWISCDPATGNLAVIFYDDRECSATECETWVAYSTDGGESWTDFRVSDVAFTPQPIAGLAANYFGDYLGITSHNLKIYPVWTDNRSGKALSYVSPINSGPAPNQPYVVHDNHSFRNTLGSQVVYPAFGDTLWVDLSAINIGDQPVEGISVTLSSPSPYLSFIDSVEFYGDFAPQQSISKNQAFVFKISDTVPDNLRLKFITKAYNNDTSWLSHFYALSSAPDLRIKKLLIEDELGNGNHIPDAGENANVGFILTNSGDFVCDSVLCQFSSHPLWVQYSDSIFRSGPLYPGQTDTVRFAVHFNDSLPYGTNLFFSLHCLSGKYIRKRTFHQRSGLRIEDWESGGFQKFPWKRTGISPWLVLQNSFEGKYAARSGTLPDGGSTILSITYAIQQPDSVSFWYRISTESNYDFFSFFVDNILYGKWSGIRDWRRTAFKVPAGQHTLRWQYEKDIYQAGGEDLVWLDYITLPVFAIPQVNAGNNLSVCLDVDSIRLSGQASDFTHLQWTTMGDGTFSNSQALDVWYFPGEAEKANGKAVLILTAFNEMASASDTLLIHIDKAPLPPLVLAAQPDTFCAGSISEIKLSGQPVNPQDVLLWYESSCSSLPLGSGPVLTVAAPSVSTVYYAMSENACGISECRSVSVKVNSLPEITLGADSVFCEGQVVVLDGGSFARYEWSNGSNQRFLMVDTTLVPTGTLHTFSLIVEDSVGCRACDSITLGFKKCAPGISENSLVSFKAFPNPSDGRLILQWIQRESLSLSLELLDNTGKTVFQKFFSKATPPLDLNIRPRPASGNYWLRIRVEGKTYIIPLQFLPFNEE
ncbi:MAG: hypothetical protein ACP5O2_05095 [Bacteroidales bacterium]